MKVEEDLHAIATFALDLCRRALPHHRGFLILYGEEGGGVIQATNLTPALVSAFLKTVESDGWSDEEVVNVPEVGKA